MVRLKVITATVNMSVNKYFNSTMVRLKVRISTISINEIRYFNSTMVRLKEYRQKYSFPLSEFQFHYGTIKRWEKCVICKS